jgi:hypothetical protein
VYALEVRIQRRPVEAVAGASLALRGGTYRTLGIHPAMLAAAVLPVTFEQAEAALAALPRLFIEPDGSFVWVADTPGLTPRGWPRGRGRSWQVDGQLYDRQGRLVYVELRGCCPAAAFDRLLCALGWPEAMLVFQLICEAVYLDETDYRRYAAASAAANARPVDREA